MTILNDPKEQTDSDEQSPPASSEPVVIEVAEPEIDEVILEPT